MMYERSYSLRGGSTYTDSSNYTSYGSRYYSGAASGYLGSAATRYNRSISSYTPYNYR